MDEIPDLIRATIRRSPTFWASACGITLRPYQHLIASAVKDSIIHHLGLTFVVIMPRQSGKNELQAHLFSWLLFRYCLVGGCIVSVSPTFKPQTLNNMDRVARSLSACCLSKDQWKSVKGFEYRLGQSSLKFFSGAATARVVGATADLLLSVDEAQEISIAKFDKDFDPMTASTNATRLFFGTAWTSATLLERERRFAAQAEKEDGIRRVFMYTAEDVIHLVPPYGEHVQRAVKQHGRNDPRIRSQYFCETIDAQSSLFNPARLALMVPSSNPAGAVRANSSQGESPLDQQSKISIHPSIAFLIDVAGQEESCPESASSRDSTALTIVSIDLSSLKTLEHPTYHVVARHSWTGENHVAIFGKLKSLSETWKPLYIVIDATGVGEGLWGMLDRHFPSRVIPVKFTQSEKSEIGWRFISIIETGRFRDHCHTDTVHLQYTHCQYEILPGPGRNLRWGVPEGARDAEGTLIHDDFILADALVARLDQLEWHLSFPTTVIDNPAMSPPDFEDYFSPECSFHF